jgi:hypothetical protein
MDTTESNSRAFGFGATVVDFCIFPSLRFPTYVSFPQSVI